MQIGFITEPSPPKMSEMTSTAPDCHGSGPQFIFSDVRGGALWNTPKIESMGSLSRGRRPKLNCAVQRLALEKGSGSNSGMIAFSWQVPRIRVGVLAYGAEIISQDVPPLGMGIAIVGMTNDQVHETVAHIAEFEGAIFLRQRPDHLHCVLDIV